MAGIHQTLAEMLERDVFQIAAARPQRQTSPRRSFVTVTLRSSPASPVKQTLIDRALVAGIDDAHAVPHRRDYPPSGRGWRCHSSELSYDEDAVAVGRVALHLPRFAEAELL
jgi:hypothetical protein